MKHNIPIYEIRSLGKIHKIKMVFLYFMSLFVLNSCLEQIDVEAPVTEGQLVVEGFIDNLSEVMVRLSTTSDINGLSNSSLTSNAIVELINEEGEVFTLSRSGDGTFFSTSPLQTEVGSKFKLRITLQNGELYESSLETILSPLNILSGDAELIREEFIDASLIEKERFFHNVTIEIENTNENQFFITDNRAFEQVEIAYPTCGFFAPPPSGSGICWAFRDEIVSNELNIGSNLQLSPTNYSFIAQSVPFSGKLEYVALIRLRRMSASQFDFLQQISDQLNRPGSIFDRPFAPIAGNIRQINGDKVALGYFAAYGTSSINVCFSRSDVPLGVNIPIMSSCSILCTDFYAPATFQDVTDLLCL